MYPIINEIGNEEYELFGVKLEPINDVEEATTFSQDPLIIKPAKSKVLSRILEQGTSESIFVKGADGKPCIDIDYWLKVSNNFILQRATIFKYNSVAQIYTASRVYPIMYDKILEMFEDYFATDDNIKSRIYLLYELNKYIKTLKAIGFRLVRGTDKKVITDQSRIISLWLGSPNCLLKANTEALMVLTGNTSYIDGNEEVPLVVDGKTRRLISWQDVTLPRSLNENCFSTYSSR